MLLFFSASALSQAKIGLPDYCKKRHQENQMLSLHEANLIKQKYTMQETAA